MRHVIRPLIALVAVGGMALGLVQLASANVPQTAHAAATTQVKGREFRFTLSSKSVAKPGTVTFNFTNTGTVAHDFKIDGKTTPLVSPGHRRSSSSGSRRPASSPTSAPCPDTPPRGCEASSRFAEREEHLSRRLSHRLWRSSRLSALS